METVVAVRDLVKRYGELVAVGGISFEVKAGEIFGLLGPNGAGKTTTVECLEGLRVPDSGEIRVLGEIPSPGNRRLKARLGIQLQGTAFLPRLTVEETLKLFAALYPRHRPIDELLELFALGEKKNTLVKDLSGGQRQRLAVALALVNDPELLVLDEPTTGLDPSARRALWDLISSLKSEGKTVLLTTHYMEEAEYLCNHVLILDRGRLIALGSPEDLVRKHFRETAVDLENPGPIAPENLRELPGVTRVVVAENKVTLYTTDVTTTVGALARMAEEGEISLGDLIWRRATLEDVYLLLTGRRLE